MRETRRSVMSRFWATALVVLLLCAPTSVFAAETVAMATPNRLLQEGVELAGSGDFDAARALLKRMTEKKEIAGKVRKWLDEFEAQNTERQRLNKADFEKYVGYAKARIERREFRKALSWVLAASDCMGANQEFLRDAWVQELVNDALAKAESFRRDKKWTEAYGIYWRLADLFQQEPRYKKLERQIVTHLRYENVFKEDSEWLERLSKTRWEDAKSALEYLGMYYVEPPDFRTITEHALEQLLLLAESPSAQKMVKGLGDEQDRADFVARVNRRLELVQAAPELDRRDCVAHLRRVVKKINPSTVDMPESLLVNEMMRGAFDPLDEFTTIIWPKEAEDFEKHTRGDFIGVGIQIIKNDKDEVEVSTPLEDTPAFRAGIQTGDVITHVDGNSISGFSLVKVVDTITGPKDSDVVLTVRRKGKAIEFPLRRALVKIQSVKGWSRDRSRGDGDAWDYWLDREMGIAYLRITNFQRNTVEDVKNVLSELQAQGLEGLVLDLRWNPGGLLDSAYHMSSLFLRDGDAVVSTKGRDPNENQTLDVRTGDGPFASLPLVVLVNDSSASASEIVSGAVRDNERGTVVGERTFGKFSVQNLITLSRTKAKLKVTTARYFLPSGASLHRDPQSETWGVEPDVHANLVRWERYNAYQMRRDADQIGPPKPATDEEKPEAEDKSGIATSSEAKKEDKKESENELASANEEESEEDETLPKLEQPDDNNRDKERDPQVETALLLMRLDLISRSEPTIAKADVKKAQEVANP